MFLFKQKPKQKYEGPAFSVFQGKQGGIDFISSFDKNLYDFGDRDEYSFMLGFSIQRFKSQENGLPEKSDIETLNKMEDKIIKLVNDNELGYYAGHSYWNHSLELIFYIKSPKKACEIIDEFQKKKTEFPFAYKVEHDPKWKQFKRLIGK